MFFVVDSDREVAPQLAIRVWQHLWELRDLAPVSAMLPAAVTSPCPLLPDEATDSVLLATMSPVPSNSAWVPLELDLLDYVDRSGGIRSSLLDAALRQAIHKGECAHSATRWTSRAQHLDSVLNRRLSVFVRGWGDIVSLRNADPGSVKTLQELRALANHVLSILVDESQKIAAAEGYCPVLDIAGARIVGHGAEMNARWRRAVTDNALRHRNLLMLSPWDIFPRAQAADFRYADLLPILACANSVSFRRDVSICNWNASRFRSFHERVGAILRQSSETPIIAKQV